MEPKVLNEMHQSESHTQHHGHYTMAHSRKCIDIDVDIADEDTAPQDFQQVLNAILFP